MEIDVGPDVKNLYDATTDGFLESNVSGLASFTLPPDSAAVVVVTPANGTISYNGRGKLINGVVVDYITPSAVSTSLTGEGRTASGEIGMKVEIGVIYAGRSGIGACQKPTRIYATDVER